MPAVKQRQHGNIFVPGKKDSGKNPFSFLILIL